MLTGQDPLMADDRRRVNEYLFHEMGLDGDPSTISDTWPFQLHPIGEVGDEPVYEFEEAGEVYFAFGERVRFLPKAGMDLGDLAAQARGSLWIAAREPISLADSRPGDLRVPTAIERLAALQALARSSGGRDATVLEGLYLARERQYLALVQGPEHGQAIVAGLPKAVTVSHASASAWRRLAWGVGTWLGGEGSANRG